MTLQELIPRQRAAASLDAFCKWAGISILLFGSKTLASALEHGEWRSGFFALVLLAQSMNHFWCRRLLRQGRFEAALARTLASVLLVFALSAVHADGNPVASVIPLLGVVVAMPHLAEKDFRRYMLAAWLLLLVHYGVWASYPSPVHASDAGRAFDRIFSCGAGVGVLFLLLWQFKKALGESVSASVMAQGEARREDGRYRQIVETTREGIWMCDLEGRVLFANQRMERMLGLGSGSMQGRPVLELLPASWRSVVGESLEAFRRGGSLQKDLYAHLKDGTASWLMLSGSPLKDAQGRFCGGLTSVTDISELRGMQLRLNQAMGLEAEGRLAGGLAHDFNNVLAVISGSSDLISRRLEKGDRAHKAVDSIRDASRQASTLIRQLLAFSKRSPAQGKIVDLGALTQDLYPLLKRLAGADLELDLEAASLPAWIRCEAGILEQILLNLIVHARSGQAGKGALKLRFEVEALEVRLLVEGLPLGSAGTTGLSAVIETVIHSGGNVEFVSMQPGRDGSLSLRLSFKRALMERPLGMAEGPGRSILLVDDDDDVRNMAVRTLKLEGFDVVGASSSAQALGFFQAEPGRFAVLITDIIMPGGFGTDLAEDLKRLKPELKILFLSGYIGDAAIQADELPPGSDFLAKPFATLELVSKALQALGATDPQSPR